MKKLLLTLSVFLINVLAVSAVDVQDFEFYQKQITAQRVPYTASGFMNSAMAGKSQIVEYFIKSGMDINTTVMGMTPLLAAVYKNQPEVVELLLKNGADVEKANPDFNPLICAIYKKNSDNVALLIKYGADVNKEFKNKKPLNFAISKNQDIITEQLINAGAIIDNAARKSAEKSKNEFIKDIVFKHN